MKSIWFLNGHDDQPPTDPSIAAVTGDQRQELVIRFNLHARAVQRFFPGAIHKPQKCLATVKGCR